MLKLPHQSNEDKEIVQEQQHFVRANNLIEEFVGEPVEVSSSFLGTKYKRDPVTNEVLFDENYKPIILDEESPIGKQYGKYIVNEKTGEILDVDTDEWLPIDEFDNKTLEQLEKTRKHIEDIRKAHNKTIDYVQGFQQRLGSGEEGADSQD